MSFDDETGVMDQPEAAVEAPAGEPFANLQPDSDETQDVTPETSPTTEESPAGETYQLPDEQLKVFPDTEIQKYAEKRYPNLAPLLANPELKAHVTQILHDKLNGDIYIENIRRASEQELEEQTEEEPETLPVAGPTPTQEQLTQEINTFVDRVTDPAVAQNYFKALNEATLKAIGPNGDGKGGDGGVQFMKVLSQGAVNLMRDAIPALLGGQNGLLENFIGDYLKTNYEGLDVSHQQQVQQNEWDNVRASDPKYANLPAYGTPEWTAAHVKAEQMVPGIKNAVFTDGRGNILPPRQQFAAKAQLAAKLIAGTATAQNVQVAAEAVETGKRIATEAAQRKQNGNLGAGQTRGKITQGTQPQGIDGARKAAIARLRNDEDPFATLRAKQ